MISFLQKLCQRHNFALFGNFLSKPICSKLYLWPNWAKRNSKSNSLIKLSFSFDAKNRLLANIYTWTKCQTTSKTLFGGYWTYFNYCQYPIFLSLTHFAHFVICYWITNIHYQRQRHFIQHIRQCIFEGCFPFMSKLPKRGNGNRKPNILFPKHYSFDVAPKYDYLTLSKVLDR